MIKRNQTLLDAVVTALRMIESQLKQQHINHFQIEWTHLLMLIQASEQSAAEGEGIDKKALIKAMMNISHKIDAEVLGLETELHGVQNYASLSQDQLSELTRKQELKIELHKVIHLIAQSPILAKHADFSDIIAMLKSEQV